MVKNYKDCLFNDKTILKSPQRFKSDHHDVYTEEVNKIAPSSNDDKILQTFDKMMIYSYGMITQIKKKKCSLIQVGRIF